MKTASRHCFTPPGISGTAGEVPLTTRRDAPCRGGRNVTTPRRCRSSLRAFRWSGAMFPYDASLQPRHAGVTQTPRSGWLNSLHRSPLAAKAGIAVECRGGKEPSCEQNVAIRSDAVSDGAGAAPPPVKHASVRS